MKHPKRNCVLLITAVLCLFGISLVGIYGWIHHDVQVAVQWAQRACPHVDDPTAALIQVAQSSHYPMRMRNRSVWALGRLRAPEALPHLELMVTGDACEHNKKLCQDELEKAILRCGGHSSQNSTKGTVSVACQSKKGGLEPKTEYLKHGSIGSVRTF